MKKKLLTPILVSASLAALLSLQPAMAKGNCQVQSKHQSSGWSFSKVKGGSHHRRGRHHQSDGQHRSSQHRRGNHHLNNWYFLEDVFNRHNNRHASTERHHGQQHHGLNHR